MQAVLPETALVKTFDRGEQPVSTLQPGDRVIGYDLAERQLVVFPVTFEPYAQEAVLQLHIQHFRWINVYAGTMVNTDRGAARADSAERFVGYCPMNPLRSSLRVVVDLAELAPTPGVVINWEGVALLWSEGLLVGS